MTRQHSAGRPRRLLGRLVAAAVLGAALGTAAPAAPARAEVTGPLIYLPDTAANAVSVYDAGAGSVVGTIPVGASPVAVALADPGKAQGFTPEEGDAVAYVANSGDGTVSAIDVATETVIATIPVGLYPDAVSYQDYTKYVFVANRDSGTVSVINILTNTVTATISLGGKTPVSMTINGGGGSLYLPETDGTVTEINTGTDTVSGDPVVGVGPQAVAFSNYSSTAYVASPGDDTVDSVNTSSGAVNGVIHLPAGSRPTAIATDPANSLVIVGEAGSDTLGLLQTATGVVTGSVPIAGVPTSISFDYHGNVYVFEQATGTIQVVDPFAKTVTATLTGFGAAAEATVAQPRLTFTQVIAPGDTVPWGAADQLTARVDVQVAGTIQFYDGTAPLGGPLTLDSYRQAYYPTSSLSPGTHTITAVFTAAGTLVNGSTSSPVTLTVTPPPLAVDQTVTKTGTSTVTTAAFSTTGPRLLVAYVASDGSSAKQSSTVSGAGLTWTLVQRADPTGSGTAEIWTAQAPGPLTNATVTSTPKISGFDQALTVVTYSGASAVGQSAAASGTTGAESAGLTTTVAGSWVFGVGEDFDRAVARTAPTGQGVVSQWVDTKPGETFWVQDQSATTPAAGTTVHINETAPTNDEWNMAAVEIVPVH